MSADIDVNALADMGAPGAKTDWNLLADMGEHVAAMTDARSPLRQKLDAVAAETGCSLKDLTVLANQNDPFRVDTPARHRDGEWLAITKQKQVGSRRIHLRGLHYAILGETKPDGTPYTNTKENWLWLQTDAAKAARWLGYIPFNEIVDQRNTPPEITRFETPEPTPIVYTGLEIEIPDADDLVPTMGLRDCRGVQPYKLVYIGEKSSLYDQLSAIAKEYAADLYLPTGEISDTLVYEMAEIAAADGRPMVVLYFSDADPSGWQMPVSVARKLQALKELEFPGLDFQVRRAALTLDQVRQHGLPSTPMKATERRADRWRAAMGIEQTEIDALAALPPIIFNRIARAASDPFFDKTLDRRVAEAKAEWVDRAQNVLDAKLGDDMLEDFREQAADKLEEMREQIEELKEQLSVDVTMDEVPAIEIPEPEMDGKVHGLPLVDSRWSFAEQCEALIAAKAYGVSERQEP